MIRKWYQRGTGDQKGTLKVYTNHSCEPNCNLEQWAVDGLPRMCFFAIEDIKSGEELTFDYKDTQGSGNGLFAMEDVKKGDYIIEYVGRIVYEEQDNVYGMRISDMDLWIDPTSTGCPAKYMNHSCEPNCNLEQWAVDGLPRMCFLLLKTSRVVRS